MKRKDMMKILGRMVIDIINILGHNTYENNIIIMIKTYQTSKGEKGDWKSEKGEQG